MTLAKSANGAPSASTAPAVPPGSSAATIIASSTTANVEVSSVFMSAQRGNVGRVLIPDRAVLPVDRPAVPSPAEALEAADVEGLGARQLHLRGIGWLDEQRVALGDYALVVRAFQLARGLCRVPHGPELGKDFGRRAGVPLAERDRPGEVGVRRVEP